MFICMFVPKDLDMVLLYRIASHKSWEVYNYFGGRYQHLPQRNHPKKKITLTPSKKNIFFFFLKLKLIMRWSTSTLFFQYKCPQRFLGAQPLGKDIAQRFVMAIALFWYHYENLSLALHLLYLILVYQPPNKMMRMTRQTLLRYLILNHPKLPVTCSLQVRGRFFIKYPVKHR